MWNIVASTFKAVGKAVVKKGLEVGKELAISACGAALGYAIFESGKNLIEKKKSNDESVA